MADLSIFILIIIKLVVGLGIVYSYSENIAPMTCRLHALTQYLSTTQVNSV